MISEQLDEFNKQCIQGRDDREFGRFMKFAQECREQITLHSEDCNKIILDQSEGYRELLKEEMNKTTFWRAAFIGTTIGQIVAVLVLAFFK